MSTSFSSYRKNGHISKTNMVKLGLSSSAVAWLQSYLSNRSQVTRAGDLFSSPGFPTSGVPQGSILGPSLFSIFINDLPSVLPTDSVVLFADDSAIYIASSKLSSLNSSLQLCLNLANTWIARNGLKLNVSKTKCMLIHSSQKVVNGCLSLETDGEKIEKVRVFKYLGVMINNTLTWSNHVNMVCKKASRSLNLLRRLSWFLPRSLLLLYLKSYILPIFDYCDVVLSSCTTDEAQRLETLLNFSCKLVLNRSRHSSASTARTELHRVVITDTRTLEIQGNK